jgi:hypothetical protein
MKPQENHCKTTGKELESMGKPGERHRKTIRQPLENHTKTVGNHVRTLRIQQENLRNTIRKQSETIGYHRKTYRRQPRSGPGGPKEHDTEYEFRIMCGTVHANRQPLCHLYFGSWDVDRPPNQEILSLNSMRKPSENHRNKMGKPLENNGTNTKTMGKP